MFRKLASVALLLLVVGAAQAQPGFNRTLGSVGITDNFGHSAFRLHLRQPLVKP